MSVPFRSTGSDEDHAAAFLRVIRHETGGYDGAFFVMNVRGEPLEFVYSRIEMPRTRLWRRQDLRRRAARELTAALFNAAASRPSVIFAMADEVDPDFFVSEIETPVPTCRVANRTALTGIAGDGRGEDKDAHERHLLWSPGPPQEGSLVRVLVDNLRKAGLLAEPFERAEAGLREARGEDVSELGAVR